MANSVNSNGLEESNPLQGRFVRPTEIGGFTERFLTEAPARSISGTLYQPSAKPELLKNFDSLIYNVGNLISHSKKSTDEEDIVTDKLKKRFEQIDHARRAGINVHLYGNPQTERRLHIKSYYRTDSDESFVSTGNLSESALASPHEQGDRAYRQINIGFSSNDRRIHKQLERIHSQLKRNVVPTSTKDVLIGSDAIEEVRTSLSKAGRGDSVTLVSPYLDDINSLTSVIAAKERGADVVVIANNPQGATPGGNTAKTTELLSMFAAHGIKVYTPSNTDELLVHSKAVSIRDKEDGSTSFIGSHNLTRAATANRSVDALLRLTGNDNANELEEIIRGLPSDFKLKTWEQKGEKISKTELNLYEAGLRDLYTLPMEIRHPLASKDERGIQDSKLPYHPTKLADTFFEDFIGRPLPTIDIYSSEYKFVTGKKDADVPREIRELDRQIADPGLGQKFNRLIGQPLYQSNLGIIGTSVRASGKFLDSLFGMSEYKESKAEEEGKREGGISELIRFQYQPDRYKDAGNFETFGLTAFNLFQGTAIAASTYATFNLSFQHIKGFAEDWAGQYLLDLPGGTTSKPQSTLVTKFQNLSRLLLFGSSYGSAFNEALDPTKASKRTVAERIHAALANPSAKTVQVNTETGEVQKMVLGEEFSLFGMQMGVRRFDKERYQHLLKPILDIINPYEVSSEAWIDFQKATSDLGKVIGQRPTILFQADMEGDTARWKPVFKGIGRDRTIEVARAWDNIGAMLPLNLAYWNPEIRKSLNLPEFDPRENLTLKDILSFEQVSLQTEHYIKPITKLVFKPREALKEFTSFSKNVLQAWKSEIKIRRAEQELLRAGSLPTELEDINIASIRESLDSLPDLEKQARLNQMQTDYVEQATRKVDAFTDNQKGYYSLLEEQEQRLRGLGLESNYIAESVSSSGASGKYQKTEEGKKRVRGAKNFIFGLGVGLIINKAIDEALLRNKGADLITQLLADAKLDDDEVAKFKFTATPPAWAVIGGSLSIGAAAGLIFPTTPDISRRPSSISSYLNKFISKAQDVSEQFDIERSRSIPSGGVLAEADEKRLQELGDNLKASKLGLKRAGDIVEEVKNRRTQVSYNWKAAAIATLFGSVAVKGLFFTGAMLANKIRGRDEPGIELDPVKDLLASKIKAAIVQEQSESSGDAQDLVNISLGHRIAQSLLVQKGGGSRTYNVASQATTPFFQVATLFSVQPDKKAGDSQGIATFAFGLQLLPILGLGISPTAPIGLRLKKPSASVEEQKEDHGLNDPMKSIPLLATAAIDTITLGASTKSADDTPSLTYVAGSQLEVASKFVGFTTLAGLAASKVKPRSALEVIEKSFSLEHQKLTNEYDQTRALLKPVERIGKGAVSVFTGLPTFVLALPFATARATGMAIAKAFQPAVGAASMKFESTFKLPSPTAGSFPWEKAGRLGRTALAFYLPLMAARLMTDQSAIEEMQDSSYRLSAMAQLGLLGGLVVHKSGLLTSSKDLANEVRSVRPASMPDSFKDSPYGQQVWDAFINDETIDPKAIKSQPRSWLSPLKLRQEIAQNEIWERGTQRIYEEASATYSMKYRGRTPDSGDLPPTKIHELPYGKLRSLMARTKMAAALGVGVVLAAKTVASIIPKETLSYMYENPLFAGLRFLSGVEPTKNKLNTHAGGSIQESIAYALNGFKEANIPGLYKDTPNPFFSPIDPFGWSFKETQTTGYLQFASPFSDLSTSAYDLISKSFSVEDAATSVRVLRNNPRNLSDILQHWRGAQPREKAMKIRDYNDSTLEAVSFSSGLTRELSRRRYEGRWLSWQRPQELLYDFIKEGVVTGRLKDTAIPTSQRRLPKTDFSLYGFLDRSTTTFSTYKLVGGLVIEDLETSSEVSSKIFDLVEEDLFKKNTTSESFNPLNVSSDLAKMPLIAPMSGAIGVLTLGAGLFTASELIGGLAYYGMRDEAQELFKRSSLGGIFEPERYEFKLIDAPEGVEGGRLLVQVDTKVSGNTERLHRLPVDVNTVEANKSLILNGDKTVDVWYAEQHKRLLTNLDRFLWGDNDRDFRRITEGFIEESVGLNTDEYLTRKDKYKEDVSKQIETKLKSSFKKKFGKISFFQAMRGGVSSDAVHNAFLDDRVTPLIKQSLDESIQRIEELRAKPEGGSSLSVGRLRLEANAALKNSQSFNSFVQLIQEPIAGSFNVEQERAAHLQRRQSSEATRSVSSFTDEELNLAGLLDDIKDPWSQGAAKTVIRGAVGVSKLTSAWVADGRNIYELGESFAILAGRDQSQSLRASAARQFTETSVWWAESAFLAKALTKVGISNPIISTAISIGGMLLLENSGLKEWGNIRAAEQAVMGAAARFLDKPVESAAKVLDPIKLGDPVRLLGNIVATPISMALSAATTPFRWLAENVTSPFLTNKEHERRKNPSILDFVSQFFIPRTSYYGQYEYIQGETTWAGAEPWVWGNNVAALRQQQVSTILSSTRSDTGVDDKFIHPYLLGRTAYFDEQVRMGGRFRNYDGTSRISSEFGLGSYAISNLLAMQLSRRQVEFQQLVTGAPTNRRAVRQSEETSKSAILTRETTKNAPALKVLFTDIWKQAPSFIEKTIDKAKGQFKKELDQDEYRSWHIISNKLTESISKAQRATKERFSLILGPIGRVKEKISFTLDRAAVELTDDIKSLAGKAFSATGQGFNKVQSKTSSILEFLSSKVVSFLDRTEDKIFEKDFIFKKRERLDRFAQKAKGSKFVQRLQALRSKTGQTANDLREVLSAKGREVLSKARKNQVVERVSSIKQRVASTIQVNFGLLWENSKDLYSNISEDFDVNTGKSREQAKTSLETITAKLSDSSEGLSKVGDRYSFGVKTRLGKVRTSIGNIFSKIDPKSLLSRLPQLGGFGLDLLFANFSDAQVKQLHTERTEAYKRDYQDAYGSVGATMGGLVASTLSSALTANPITRLLSVFAGVSIGGTLGEKWGEKAFEKDNASSPLDHVGQAFLLGSLTTIAQLPSLLKGVTSRQVLPAIAKRLLLNTLAGGALGGLLDLGSATSLTISSYLPQTFKQVRKASDLLDRKIWQPAKAWRDARQAARLPLNLEGLVESGKRFADTSLAGIGRHLKQVYGKVKAAFLQETADDVSLPKSLEKVNQDISARRLGIENIQSIQADYRSGSLTSEQVFNKLEGSLTRDNSAVRNVMSAARKNASSTDEVLSAAISYLKANQAFSRASTVPIRAKAAITRAAAPVTRGLKAVGLGWTGLFDGAFTVADPLLAMGGYQRFVDFNKDRAGRKGELNRYETRQLTEATEYQQEMMQSSIAGNLAGFLFKNPIFHLAAGILGGAAGSGELIGWDAFGLLKPFKDPFGISRRRVEENKKRAEEGHAIYDPIQAQSFYWKINKDFALARAATTEFIRPEREKITSGFKWLGSKIWQGVSKLGSLAWSGLNYAAAKGYNFGRGLGREIKARVPRPALEFIKGFIPYSKDLISSFKDRSQKLIDSAKSLAKHTSHIVKNFGHEVVSKFKELKAGIKLPNLPLLGLRNAYSSIRKRIKSSIDWLKGLAKFKRPETSWIKTLLSNTKQITKDVTSRIFSTLRSIYLPTSFAELKEKGHEIGLRVTDFFSNKLSLVREKFKPVLAKGRNLVDNFLEAGINFAEQSGRWISKRASDIRYGASSLIGAFLEAPSEWLANKTKSSIALAKDSLRRANVLSRFYTRKVVRKTRKQIGRLGDWSLDRARDLYKRSTLVRGVARKGIELVDSALGMRGTLKSSLIKGADALGNRISALGFKETALDAIGPALDIATFLSGAKEAYDLKDRPETNLANYESAYVKAYSAAGSLIGSVFGALTFGGLGDFAFSTAGQFLNRDAAEQKAKERYEARDFRDPLAATATVVEDLFAPTIRSLALTGVASTATKYLIDKGLETSFAKSAIGKVASSKVGQRFGAAKAAVEATKEKLFNKAAARFANFVPEGTAALSKTSYEAIKRTPGILAKGALRIAGVVDMIVNPLLITSGFINLARAETKAERRSAEKRIWGATGAMTGAATGAFYGSTFGPIGTAVGAVIGGLVGEFLGNKRGEAIADSNEQDKGIAGQALLVSIATAASGYAAYQTRVNTKSYYKGATDIASRILSDTYRRADLLHQASESIDIKFSRARGVSGSYDVKSRSLTLSSEVRDIFARMADYRKVSSRDVSKATFTALHESWHAAQYDPNASANLSRVSTFDAIPDPVRPKLITLSKQSTIEYAEQALRKGKTLTQIELDNIYQKELAANVYAYKNTNEAASRFVYQRKGYQANVDDFIDSLRLNTSKTESLYDQLFSKASSSAIPSGGLDEGSLPLNLKRAVGSNLAPEVKGIWRNFLNFPKALLTVFDPVLDNPAWKPKRKIKERLFSMAAPETGWWEEEMGKRTPVNEMLAGLHQRRAELKRTIPKFELTVSLEGKMLKHHLLNVFTNEVIQPLDSADLADPKAQQKFVEEYVSKNMTHEQRLKFISTYEKQPKVVRGGIEWERKISVASSRRKVAERILFLQKAGSDFNQSLKVKDLAAITGQDIIQGNSLEVGSLGYEADKSLPLKFSSSATTYKEFIQDFSAHYQSQYGNQSTQGTRQADILFETRTHGVITSITRRLQFALSRSEHQVRLFYNSLGILSMNAAREAANATRPIRRLWKGLETRMGRIGLKPLDVLHVGFTAMDFKEGLSVKKDYEDLAEKRKAGHVLSRAELKEARQRETRVFLPNVMGNLTGFFSGNPLLGIGVALGGVQFVQSGAFGLVDKLVDKDVKDQEEGHYIGQTFAPSFYVRTNQEMEGAKMVGRRLLRPVMRAPGRILRYIWDQTPNLRKGAGDFVIGVTTKAYQAAIIVGAVVSPILSPTFSLVKAFAEQAQKLISFSAEKIVQAGEYITNKVSQGIDYASTKLAQAAEFTSRKALQFQNFVTTKSAQATRYISSKATAISSRFATEFAKRPRAYTGAALGLLTIGTYLGKGFIDSARKRIQEQATSAIESSSFLSEEQKASLVGGVDSVSSVASAENITKSSGSGSALAFLWAVTPIIIGKLINPLRRKTKELVGLGRKKVANFLELTKEAVNKSVLSTKRGVTNSITSFLRKPFSESWTLKGAKVIAKPGGILALASIGSLLVPDDLLKQQVPFPTPSFSISLPTINPYVGGAAISIGSSYLVRRQIGEGLNEMRSSLQLKLALGRSRVKAFLSNALSGIQPLKTLSRFISARPTKTALLALLLMPVMDKLSEVSGEKLNIPFALPKIPNIFKNLKLNLDDETRLKLGLTSGSILALSNTGIKRAIWKHKSSLLQVAAATYAATQFADDKLDEGDLYASAGLLSTSPQLRRELKTLLNPQSWKQKRLFIARRNRLTREFNNGVGLVFGALSVKALTDQELNWKDALMPGILFASQAARITKKGSRLATSLKAGYIGSAIGLGLQAGYKIATGDIKFPFPSAPPQFNNIIDLLKKTKDKLIDVFTPKIPSLNFDIGLDNRIKLGSASAGILLLSNKDFRGLVWRNRKAIGSSAFQLTGLAYAARQWGDDKLDEKDLYGVGGIMLTSSRFRKEVSTLVRPQGWAQKRLSIIRGRRLKTLVKAGSITTALGISAQLVYGLTTGEVSLPKLFAGENPIQQLFSKLATSFKSLLKPPELSDEDRLKMGIGSLTLLSLASKDTRQFGLGLINATTKQLGKELRILRTPNGWSEKRLSIIRRRRLRRDGHNLTSLALGALTYEALSDDKLDIKDSIMPALLLAQQGTRFASKGYKANIAVKFGKVGAFTGMMFALGAEFESGRFKAPNFNLPSLPSFNLPGFDFPSFKNPFDFFGQVERPSDQVLLAAGTLSASLLIKPAIKALPKARWAARIAFINMPSIALDSFRELRAKADKALGVIRDVTTRLTSGLFEGLTTIRDSSLRALSSLKEVVHSRLAPLTNTYKALPKKTIASAAFGLGLGAWSYRAWTDDKQDWQDVAAPITTAAFTTWKAAPIINKVFPKARWAARIAFINVPSVLMQGVKAIDRGIERGIGKAISKISTPLASKVAAKGWKQIGGDILANAADAFFLNESIKGMLSLNGSSSIEEVEAAYQQTAQTTEAISWGAAGELAFGGLGNVLLGSIAGYNSTSSAKERAKEAWQTRDFGLAPVLQEAVKPLTRDMHVKIRATQLAAERGGKLYNAASKSVAPIARQNKFIGFINKYLFTAPKVAFSQATRHLQREAAQRLVNVRFTQHLKPAAAFKSFGQGAAQKLAPLLKSFGWVGKVAKAATFAEFVIEPIIMTSGWDRTSKARTEQEFISAQKRTWGATIALSGFSIGLASRSPFVAAITGILGEALGNKIGEGAGKRAYRQALKDTSFGKTLASKQSAGSIVGAALGVGAAIGAGILLGLGAAIIIPAALIAGGVGLAVGLFTGESLAYRESNRRLNRQKQLEAQTETSKKTIQANSPSVIKPQDLEQKQKEEALYLARLQKERQEEDKTQENVPWWKRAWNFLGSLAGRIGKGVKGFFSRGQEKITSFWRGIKRIFTGTSTTPSTGSSLSIPSSPVPTITIKGVDYSSLATLPGIRNLPEVYALSQLKPTPTQSYRTNNVASFSRSGNLDRLSDAEKFVRAARFVRKAEGGNTDNPNDIGGRTGSGGILQGEYNRYRRSRKLAPQDVFKITEREIRDIYYNKYWKEFKRGRVFSAALAVVYLDTYINFNPQTADKFFSNLPKDQTQAAKIVIQRRKAYRAQRVRENYTQRVFYQGWINRDNALLAEVNKIDKENGRASIKVAAPSTSVSNRASTNFYQQTSASAPASYQPATSSSTEVRTARYQVDSWGGRMGQRNNIKNFDQAVPHWPGTGGYVSYRRGRDGIMRSYIRGSNKMAYDFQIKINGSYNVPVPSIVGGVVIGIDRGHGTVKIRDDSGRVHALHHLRTVSVKKGQKVSYGQLLGIQGTVGPTSTGVHAHWETYEDRLRRYIPDLTRGSFIEGDTTVIARNPNVSKYQQASYTKTSTANMQQLYGDNYQAMLNIATGLSTYDKAQKEQLAINLKGIATRHAVVGIHVAGYGTKAIAYTSVDPKAPVDRVNKTFLTTATFIIDGRKVKVSVRSKNKAAVSNTLEELGQTLGTAIGLKKIGQATKTNPLKVKVQLLSATSFTGDALKVLKNRVDKNLSLETTALIDARQTAEKYKAYKDGVARRSPSAQLISHKHDDHDDDDHSSHSHSHDNHSHGSHSHSDHSPKYSGNSIGGKRPNAKLNPQHDRRISGAWYQKQLAVRGVDPARFNSGYGWRWGRGHAGVDINVPGQKYYSIFEKAEILYIGWRGAGFGYRWQIAEIDPKTNKKTGRVISNSHQASLPTNLRVGQIIKGGTYLGREGATQSVVGVNTGQIHGHVMQHSPTGQLNVGGVQFERAYGGSEIVAPPEVDIIAALIQQKVIPARSLGQTTVASTKKKAKPRQTVAKKKLSNPPDQATVSSPPKKKKPLALPTVLSKDARERILQAAARADIEPNQVAAALNVVANEAVLAKEQVEKVRVAMATRQVVLPAPVPNTPTPRSSDTTAPTQAQTHTDITIATTRGATGKTKVQIAVSRGDKQWINDRWQQVTGIPNPHEYGHLDTGNGAAA